MKAIFRRLLAVSTLIIFWLVGLTWFVMQIPHQPLSDDRATDALVVLTGGSGRIEHGFRLLAQHKAPLLFISGVNKEVGVATLIRSNSNKLQRADIVDEQSVNLGHDASSTLENAKETLAWVNNNNIHSIRLITSNYHMPRSMQEFRYVMPDITIIADPVIPADFMLNRWWEDPYSGRLMLGEYHKTIGGMLRHWFEKIQ